MKIKEFRFLSNRERFIEREFINWSRSYEWGYVLQNLKGFNKVHNTCCGGSMNLHKQFHDKINQSVIDLHNSDIFQTEINKNFKNFHIYNILEPREDKFDSVICISTLEELPDKEKNLKLAFDNLYNQLNDGGRLIITCDFPDVDVKHLESIVGKKCGDTNNRLNGSNSIYKQNEFSHLNIILLDLEKN